MQTIFPGRIKIFLMLGVAFLFLNGSTPLLAQDVRVQACQQAEIDADTETNQALWLAAGFFGGIAGVLVAYVLQPNPPASKFLGKSPAYVAAYSECYRQKARDIRTKKAWLGCLAGALLGVSVSIGISF